MSDFKIDEIGRGVLDLAGKRGFFDVWDVADEVIDAHRLLAADAPGATRAFRDKLKEIIARITGAAPADVTTAQAMIFQDRLYAAYEELQKKTLGTPTPASSASTAPTPDPSAAPAAAP